MIHCGTKNLYILIIMKWNVAKKNKKQVKLELIDSKIVWLIFLMEPRRTDLSSELLEQ